MKAGAVQLEKAINLWYVQKNEPLAGGWGSTTPLSNGNCSDGTGGWVAAGTYVCTLEGILIDAGLITSGFTRSLPTNTAYGNYTNGTLALMFYPCGSNTGAYALYCHLRSPTAEDTASLTSVESKGCPNGPRVNYGMKAATLITLR